MQTIEFFFDVGSPYTYLASTQLAALEARSGARVRWRPFLLGGVFKAVGNIIPANIPGKGPHMLVDLRRWADHYGVPFAWTSHFPVNSLQAMRALAALPEDEIPALADLLFRAVWVDGLNIADPAVLGELIGAERLARADDPAVKALLRANTDEAVARGAFGAPTFFVGDQMFFGNDRFLFLEQALRA